jgi:nicotinamidase-related amidase
LDAATFTQSSQRLAHGQTGVVLAFEERQPARPFGGDRWSAKCIRWARRAPATPGARTRAKTSSCKEPEDIKVDKYRISGFWDTPLDSILRNLGTRTVPFAGVNTDQCVMHSLTDANFLGYGCVMVEDCCATTSPDFCTEASVWNVKKCFGFVTDSGKILKALKK